MAKVFYSGLVNRMAGRVSHSVMSNWKGMGIIKRHNAAPHQPRTEKQQDVRGFLNDLAGEWYSLTSTQKELWDSWVAMYHLPLTGLNAYALFNQLGQKYLPGTTKKTAPPPSPATPEHPQGIAVTALAAADFCVTWTAPNGATLVGIVDYWAMPGRDNTISPRWTFGGSAAGSALLVVVATTYPTGTILKFRVRMMDSDFRVSPWSHIIQDTAL